VVERLVSFISDRIGTLYSTGQLSYHFAINCEGVEKIMIQSCVYKTAVVFVGLPPGLC
jgi:hypothetical protein